MDLTTLRLETRERLGELAADFFSDAEVDRAINDGLVRFSQEEQWPWLYTELTGVLASGSDLYLLPDNITSARLFNMSISGGSLTYPRLVERVEPHAGYKLKHLYVTRHSAPIAYFIAYAARADSTTFDMTARFIPVPEVDYDVSLLYMRVPAALSGAGDVPDIPDEYVDAIPSWAAGKLFLKEMQISQKAQEQFSLYQKVLGQAREDFQTDNPDEVVAWGRQPDLERMRSRLTAFDRISPTLGP